MKTTWQQKSIIPTLVALVIGVLGALFSTLIHHEALLEVAVGILAGIAALQVGELWQLHSRTPRLSRLENVLADNILYRHVDLIINTNSKIDELARKQGLIGQFFRDQREKCLEQARDTLTRLAAGQITISDPDQQFKVAVDLAGFASNSIRTVSYQDEQFWTLGAGKSYLQHNRNLIERGGRVQRIFVFDDDYSALKQRAMIQQHIDANVQTYILPSGRMFPIDHEDFVIYDDSFVRYARPVEFGGSKKEASIDVTQATYRAYEERFANLLLRSEPAQEFLDQLDQEVRSATITPPGSNPPPRMIRRAREKLAVFLTVDETISNEDNKTI